LFFSTKTRSRPERLNFSHKRKIDIDFFMSGGRAVVDGIGASFWQKRREMSMPVQGANHYAGEKEAHWDLNLEKEKKYFREARIE